MGNLHVVNAFMQVHGVDAGHDIRSRTALLRLLVLVREISASPKHV